MILKYTGLFHDVPSKTNLVQYGVDVGNAMPGKQHSYRVNPLKLEQMRKEFKYMLENDKTEHSQSSWASPSILLPKPDSSQRYCTDIRKVNSLSKTDSSPILIVEDCIDKIGQAIFISKCDLLIGYWCVPLTERSKKISAFLTPDELY